MQWNNLSDRGDLDWEGRVVSAHHKLAVIERRMLAGDSSDQELWKRCDWDFHHALISACGSDVLLETHALIYDRYLRYQMIAVVFRGEIAAREHQELLECALARDSKRAQDILVSHIEGCVEDALQERRRGHIQPAVARTIVGPLAKDVSRRNFRRSNRGNTGPNPTVRPARPERACALRRRSPGAIACD